MTKGSTGDTNRGETDTDDPPSAETELAALRIAREMGRSVIDHQIEGLSSLNKKAVNTIRLNILILGVVLTVFSLVINGNSTQEEATLSIINGATGAGVLLSGISILAALWTYTSTRKEVGPTGNSILKSIDADEGYSERGWLKGTIRAQADWIATNDKVNRRDSFTLFIGHLYLFVSLGLYSFGVIWGLGNLGEATTLYWGIIVVLSFLLPSIVISPKLLDGAHVPDWVSTKFEKAFNSLMDEE